VSRRCRRLQRAAAAWPGKATKPTEWLVTPGDAAESVGTVVPSICLTQACTVAQYLAVDGLLERLVAVIRVASPWSRSTWSCRPRSNCLRSSYLRNRLARSASGGVPPVGVGPTGGSVASEARLRTCIPPALAGTAVERRALPLLRGVASAGAAPGVGLRRRALLELGFRGAGGRRSGFAYGTPHQVARHGALRVATPSYTSQKNAFPARSEVTSRGARAPIAINYLSASVGSRSAESFGQLAGTTRSTVLPRGPQPARLFLPFSLGGPQPARLFSRGARSPLKALSALPGQLSF
jgi:hypothetical protein